MKSESISAGWYLKGQGSYNDFFFFPKQEVQVKPFNRDKQTFFVLTLDFNLYYPQALVPSTLSLHMTFISYLWRRCAEVTALLRLQHPSQLKDISFFITILKNSSLHRNYHSSLIYTISWNMTASSELLRLQKHAEDSAVGSWTLAFLKAISHSARVCKKVKF